MRVFRNISLLILLVGLLAACQSNPTKPIPEAEEGETYFSTAQFLTDQIELLRGQIYTLQKVVELNGQRDSTVVAIPTENWAPVYKAFLNADIGKPKFLGQYRFSEFEDPLTFTHSYIYEATEPKLPVRRLMINASLENNRIRSLLAETETSSFWNDNRTKLYYAPLKVIQIQEWNHPLIGADKTFRAEYRFLVNREEE